MKAQLVTAQPLEEFTPRPCGFLGCDRPGTALLLLWSGQREKLRWIADVCTEHVDAHATRSALKGEVLDRLEFLGAVVTEGA